jgi:hypothetical protein
MDEQLEEYIARLQFLLKGRGLQIETLIELLVEAGLFSREQFVERLGVIETRQRENEDRLRREEEIRRSFEETGDDDPGPTM